MRNWILVKDALFGILVLLAILAGIQYAVNYSVLAWSQVGEGVCQPVKLYKHGGNSLVLNVKWQGKEYWTDDAEVIVSYVHRPGPLKCKLYATSKAFCEPGK